jgi:hypothetical protein
VNVLTPEAEELFVNNGALQPSTTYQWRVLCGCQLNPLVVTPWSQVSSFTTGANAIASDFGSEDPIFGNMGVVNVFPNPAKGEVNVFANFKISEIRVSDITGRTVIQRNPGLVDYTLIDIAELARGTYLIEAIGLNEKVTQKLLVE